LERRVALSVLVWMFAKTFISITSYYKQETQKEASATLLCSKRKVVSSKYSIFFAPSAKSFLFPTIRMEVSVSFNVSITAFSLVALKFEITKFKAIAQDGIANNELGIKLITFTATSDAMLNKAFTFALKNP